MSSSAVQVGRWFALVALMALPFACSGALAAPASASPWLTQPEISGPGASGQPQVAVGSSGDAVAVWTRTEGSENHIEAAVKPLGEPWEAPAPISAPSPATLDPTVAVDASGDAVAVWQIVVGNESVVEAATRPAGEPWTSPEVISPAGEEAVGPDIALDGAGDAVVVWEAVGGSSDVIDVAARPAGGAWGAAQGISPSGHRCVEPRVAVDPSGDAVVVWDWVNGISTTVEASSSVGGASWSAAETVSAAGQPAYAPKPAIDASGDAMAVWETFEGSYAVKSAERPAGGAWGPIEAISSPGRESGAAQVALDSAGDAVAIWKDGITALLASSRPAGGSWQAPAEISMPGEEVEGVPSLGVDPSGDAVALWSSAEGGENIVRATSRSAGGAWESPPVELERSGEELFEDDVAIAPTGSAVAVWRQSRGSEALIGSADQGVFLAVHKAGVGSGTVTSDPARIDCGTVCESEFREGTQVTLTATPAAGSRFAGWSGDCGGSGACEVTMDAIRSVTAEFVPVPVPAPVPAPVPSSPALAQPAPTNAPADSCSLVRASAASFVPTRKAGKVVAGVRARISVSTPSRVQVSPTLTYRDKTGRRRSVGLLTRTLQIGVTRNMRIALPPDLRSRLPLKTEVGLSLRISAVPDASPQCASTDTTKRLKLAVVDVLAAPQSGVS
jgi:hypothetical protein